MDSLPDEKMLVKIRAQIHKAKLLPKINKQLTPPAVKPNYHNKKEFIDFSVLGSSIATFNLSDYESKSKENIKSKSNE